MSIIRLSGPDSVPIAQRLFRPSGRRDASWQPCSHCIYHGQLTDLQGSSVDEVPFLLITRSGHLFNLNFIP